MSARYADMTIAAGTEFTGQIRGGDLVEIHGSAEGTIVTRRLLIAEGGKFKGSVKADEVLVHGALRGDANVQRLLTISASGDVVGRIRYGQLVLERGGHLSADMRNVPPELAGDFEITVPRGGLVTITPEDLFATDANDPATALTFKPSALLHGWIARAEAAHVAIDEFTQADINAGQIVFVHDGDGQRGGFDVVVTDREGATAGAPRPVLVRIEG